MKHLLQPRGPLISDFGLELYDLKGEYIETRSSLTSSVKSHIKLENLPTEELIVLFDNASTSNFSVKYTSSPILEPESRDLIVKSIDSELGIVEVLDAATRQSLATRVIDVDGRFSALGFDFESLVVAQLPVTNLKSNTLQVVMQTPIIC